MAKQIFRKEALERMSSPEQLDQLMPVTSRRGWIVLTGIGALLAAAVLWGIFGSIETTVPAGGALLRVGAMEIVRAPGNGEAVEVFVSVGDHVEAGRELLRFTTYDAEGGSASTTIRSEGAGRVLDVAVISGDSVEQGAMLVSLETPSRPMQAVLFVSTRDGYKVESGMRVKVTPATANRYASQQLLGEVRSAGRYPASRDVVFRALQNEDWAASVTQDGPVLEVLVDLPQSERMEEFYSGTPCRAEIAIDRKSPLEFVIPVVGAR